MAGTEQDFSRAVDSVLEGATATGPVTGLQLVTHGYERQVRMQLSPQTNVEELAAIACKGGDCEYKNFATAYGVDIEIGQRACEQFLTTAAIYGEPVSCGAAAAAIVNMGMRGRD